ncbi:MAG: DUF5668 domain-containing protein [Chloroflexota bacterium]|nr:DUF5668 domain-containing protein [Chloroflexota bacterium]
MDSSQRPERSHHHGGFVGPTILIGLGVLLLLSNLGMLQWSVWDTAWRLWPILLIAAGLDVLIGRRSAVGSLLSALILLALIVGGVWLVAAPGGAGVGALGREISGQSVSQALDGARLAEVSIRPAAASLRVAGGAPAGKLVEGTVAVQDGEAATSDSRLASDVLYYSVESREARAVFGPWGGGRVWDLRLTDQAQLTLRVGMGAGQANLDLRGLKLTSLVVEIGAGQTTVTLPSGGRVQARVSVAMGEVIIRVPRGTAYRVNARAALGSSRLPNGEGNFGSSTATSPGFESAQDRVDVDVSCAMGSVVVQEY